MDIHHDAARIVDDGVDHGMENGSDNNEEKESIANNEDTEHNANDEHHILFHKTY